MGDEQLLSRVERLEAEVSGIRAREEIVRIQYMYGYYLDNRMWPEMVELFCDDQPWMEIGRRGRYNGKDAIYAFLHDAMGQGRWGLEKNRIANHMQIQPIVTLAPDGMSARVRARALIQMSDLPRRDRLRMADGLYENLFVREPGGWKIKELWWAATFYGWFTLEGDYWHESVPENDGVEADARSTDPDAALGRIWVPFHYPHPYTGEETPPPAANVPRRAKPFS